MKALSSTHLKLGLRYFCVQGWRRNRHMCLVGLSSLIIWHDLSVLFRKGFSYLPCYIASRMKRLCYLKSMGLRLDVFCLFLVLCCRQPDLCVCISLLKHPDLKTTPPSHSCRCKIAFDFKAIECVNCVYIIVSSWPPLLTLCLGLQLTWCLALLPGCRLASLALMSPLFIRGVQFVFWIFLGCWADCTCCC